MRLSTAIRHFETQLFADGKSPHTLDAYMRDLGFFSRWVGQTVVIASIKTDTVARYLSSKAFIEKTGGEHRSVVSINRSKSALRSFFRFLTDSGYLSKNPARLVRSAPTPQRPPRVLSEREIRALFATIKKQNTSFAQRDFVMFSLLLGTGMRLGSLVNLKVSDIDLCPGTLRVNGKGNAEQVLFLNSPLRRLLRNRFRHITTEVVFPIGERQVQLRFSLWLKKARIKRHYSVHCLRHTFATRLYERTGDLRLVQVALGHRQVSTTEIYTRVVSKTIKRALNNIGLVI